MGNVLAQPSRVPADPLADLPNVVLKETLGMLQRCLQDTLCAGRLVCSSDAFEVLPHFSEPAWPTIWQNMYCFTGGGRFLKTLLCLHDEGGLVVVKARKDC